MQAVTINSKFSLPGLIVASVVLRPFEGRRITGAGNVKLFHIQSDISQLKALASQSCTISTSTEVLNYVFKPYSLTSIAGCNSSLEKKFGRTINPLSKYCSSCHCSSCPGFFSTGWGGITVYTSGAGRSSPKAAGQANQHMGAWWVGLGSSGMLHNMYSPSNLWVGKSVYTIE